MTEQEVFTQSVTAIIAQGGPSHVPGKGCAYRDHLNNRACAVGALLSDEEYHPDMDAPLQDTSVSAINLPDRLKPHLRLLRKLQGAHDSMETDADLPLFLNRVAQLGLEMPQ